MEVVEEVAVGVVVVEVVVDVVVEVVVGVLVEELDLGVVVVKVVDGVVVVEVVVAVVVVEVVVGVVVVEVVVGVVLVEVLIVEVVFGVLVVEVFLAVVVVAVVVGVVVVEVVVVVVVEVVDVLVVVGVVVVEVVVGVELLEVVLFVVLEDAVGVVLVDDDVVERVVIVVAAFEVVAVSGTPSLKLISPFILLCQSLFIVIFYFFILPSFSCDLSALSLFSLVRQNFTFPFRYIYSIYPKYIVRFWKYEKLKQNLFPRVHPLFFQCHIQQVSFFNRYPISNGRKLIGFTKNYIEFSFCGI